MSTALVPYLSPALRETADLRLSEDQIKKLELMAGETTSIRESLKPIETALEAHAVSDLLNRVDVALKELDRTRRKHVDPLNNEVKEVNAIFKGITSQLDEIDAKARTYHSAWTQREKARVRREQEEAERKQREAAEAEAAAMAKAAAATSEKARAKALAEADKASAAQANALIAAPAPAPTAYRGDFGTVSTREAWTFEVVKAADVPREYLCVDEKLIRAAVKAGVRQIAGVNIYQDDQVVVRAGR